MRGEVGVQTPHPYEPWYQAEQDGASSVQLRKKPKRRRAWLLVVGLQIAGLRLGCDTSWQGRSNLAKLNFLGLETSWSRLEDVEIC